jgi:hypothetical protein
MRRHFRSAFALAWLFLLGAPRLTQAEEPPLLSDRRHIAGHAFLPTSSGVDAPLAVTSFGLETNLVYGHATGPFYDRNGILIDSSRTYDVGGFGESVRYQWAANEHLALRGVLTTALVSGLNRSAAMVVGTTALVGGSVGAEGSFAVADTARLGFALDVQRTPQLNVLVSGAVLKALQERVLDVASALEIDQLLTWRPSVAISLVPIPAFGLTGRVTYVYSRLSTEAYGFRERQSIALGAAADLDVRRLWESVPMSVNLVVVDSISLGGEAENGLLDLSTGVMYTGKKDVDLGVIFGGQRLHIRPQFPAPLKTDLVYVDFAIRVYWP